MTNEQALYIVREEFKKNNYSEDFINALINALTSGDTELSVLDYFSERLIKNFDKTLGGIKISNDDIARDENLKPDPQLANKVEDSVNELTDSLKELENSNKQTDTDVEIPTEEIASEVAKEK